MLDGLDDVFGDPNGSAYQAREERVGPPLTYVAEKLGNALRAAHGVVAALSGTQPGHLSPLPSTVPADTIEEYRRRAHLCFHYNLIAYLALTNMLAAAADPDLAERLGAYSGPDFGDWLDDIERGGWVTG